MPSNARGCPNIWALESIEKEVSFNFLPDLSVKIKKKNWKYSAMNWLDP